MNKNEIQITPELKLLLLLSTKKAIFNINNYIECTEIQYMLKNNINWDLLINSAILHGLIPLLYTSIPKINNINIPDYAIKRIVAENQIRKINTIKLVLEIKRINSLFVENNIVIGQQYFQ